MTRGDGFKLKEPIFRLDKRKNFFYHEGAETREQVAQRGGRCLILVNIQGQAGCGFEQLGVVEGVPAHLQGCWTRSPLKVPSNPNHPTILILSAYRIRLNLEICITCSTSTIESASRHRSNSVGAAVPKSNTMTMHCS